MTASPSAIINVLLNAWVSGMHHVTWTVDGTFECFIAFGWFWGRIGKFIAFRAGAFVTYKSNFITFTIKFPLTADNLFRCLEPFECIWPCSQNGRVTWIPNQMLSPGAKQNQNQIWMPHLCKLGLYKLYSLQPPFPIDILCRSSHKNHPSLVTSLNSFSS